MGYRIDVITDSVQEAIRHAGGLMFDRRRAGWDVVVVTGDTAAHPRALIILGARAESPDQPEKRLCRTEREIRTVLSPLGHPDAEREPAAKREPRVQLLRWGQHVDTALTSGLHPVRHNLSPAARTFKAQALQATGLATRVHYCEPFWADTTLDTGLFRDLLFAGTHPRSARGAQAGRGSPTVVRGFAGG